MSAVAPPDTCTRLSIVFHAESAEDRRPAKLNDGFSVDRFCCALATLTYDSPIATCTVWLDVVSKVTKAPVLVPLVDDEPFETVPPFQVPCEVGVRSNAIAKNTLNVFDEPQNPPPVVFPVTMLPEKLTEPLRLPVAIRLVLMSNRALVDDGYVRFAM